ncbi:MAG: Ger(x)C family spore germination protein [Limnochordia bacterium]
MRNLVLLVILSLVLLSGCWDLRDIERRANITAVGIDLLPKAPREDLTGKDPLEEEHQPKYRMTMEIPVLRELGGTEQSGGQSQGKPAWVLSSTGTSPGQITALLDLRLWREPYFGQARVLVIGEEAARQSLKDPLDFFHRHREVSRRMKLVIAKGDAEQVIKVSPEIENLLGIYLDNLIELVTLSGRIQRKNLGEAARDLFSNGNALLPRARPEKTEVTVGGSAVIKNWQLVGWLGELETMGSLFASDRIRGGLLVVGNPEANTGEIAFIIRSSNTRIKVVPAGDRICFQFHIFTEGDVVEQLGGKLLGEPPLIKSIEELVQQEIVDVTLGAMGKLQREFRVDPLGLGDRVWKQQPRIWEQVKANWDEYHFPRAKVQVQSQVRIRRIGVTG